MTKRFFYLASSSLSSFPPFPQPIHHPPKPPSSNNMPDSVPPPNGPTAVALPEQSIYDGESDSSKVLKEFERVSTRARTTLSAAPAAKDEGLSEQQASQQSQKTKGVVRARDEEGDIHRFRVTGFSMNKKAVVRDLICEQGVSLQDMCMRTVDSPDGGLEIAAFVTTRSRDQETKIRKLHGKRLDEKEETEVLIVVEIVSETCLGGVQSMTGDAVRTGLMEMSQKLSRTEGDDFLVPFRRFFRIASGIF